ncbi:hypothetical protein L3Q82_014632 [Scortum barcoo]|uniref:Uncharacterized protein n=1 Tax=Scortum barcoo TaxID=214431 RepID=A0ACB8VXN3_9TELE|nr:hypothetical protein L3Q82_014632 [Scortum barcoo]
MGSGEPLLRAVRSLYDRSRSLIRIAGSKSDLFPVHVGLRQGCPLSPVLFIIFMDRISRRSQGPEGVRFGNHRISSLLFADDVVLMASSGQDLQHVLERFAAECEAAGMRISTSKSEAMVLDRKRVACPLQVGGESCLKWRSSSISGSCSRVRERSSVRLTGGLVQRSAVMRKSMYADRTVVVKKELSRKAKLSIYSQSTFPPSPMVMNFGAAAPYRIERSQLRWLGHLFRMPPGRLPREVFQAYPTGRRPRGRPRTRWRNTMYSRLAWERLGVPPEELEEVSGVREVWASLLRLLPPSTRSRTKRMKKMKKKKKMKMNFVM